MLSHVLRSILLSITCVLLAGQPARSAPAAREKAAAASSWHDYFTELLELNKRTLAGAYKELGKHGDWDDAAVKFLDEAAVAFTYGGTSTTYRDVEPPAPEQLIESGQAAIDAGCADPLVAFCLGEILFTHGRIADALPHLRAAAAGVLEMNYADRWVWLANLRLATLEPKSKAGKAAKEVADQRLLRLGCGKLENAARRFAAMRIQEQMNRISREDQSKLIETLRQFPDVDPWVADTLDGRLEINLAWDKRGGGWAAEVTPEGWTGFFDHLGKAHERLTRAWKLNPKLPEPASSMISVAMGAGDQLKETPIKWFNHAVGAQLDYTDAYNSIFNALLPRWGGSHAEVYQVGLRGARTKRFDTDAPWQLIRAVEAISNDTGKRWGELSRPGVYAQLAEVVDAYDKFAEKKNGNTWYRTFRACLAWRAERYAEARGILDKLGDRADMNAFAYGDATATAGAIHPAVARAQVYALTGPNMAAVKRAEAALTKENWAAALAEYEKLHAPWGDLHDNDAALAHADALGADPGPAPKADPGPPDGDGLDDGPADAVDTGPADAIAEGPADGPAKNAAKDKGDEREHLYYDQRIRTLGRRVNLAKGETVVIQPDATFEGWVRRAGKWWVADDGALRGQLTQFDTPYALFQEDTGRRYELKGIAGHTEGGTRAAVLLAGEKKWTWVMFYERTVLVKYPGGHRSFKRERSPESEFVLRLDDATLNVTVNGAVVVDNLQLPPSMHTDQGFGVGAVDDYRGEAVFRNLTIRRLTDKDPPLQPKEVAQ